MPATQYAKSGDVHIAYRVFGAGPNDLVFLSSWISQIEHIRAWPAGARFYDRLARFARVIVLDKRGAGLSDPVEGTPTIDERMDDVRAVMDAVGSERAAILGTSEGGALGAVVAATHPDRADALVMAGSAARFAAGPDYRMGWTAEFQRTSSSTSSRRGAQGWVHPRWRRIRRQTKTFAAGMHSSNVSPVVPAP